MYIWIALAIPVIVTIILLVFFQKKIVWWELLIPFPITLICILGFKYSVEYIRTSDVQYEGDLISQIQYHEYWESWVHKTCSRQSCTGSGKTRTCTTVYYDCSYCDENPAKYLAISQGGENYKISKEKYTSLKTLWGNESFKDLNRSINHHFACGKDGDMYFSNWDGKVLSSEASVEKTTYTNYVQASHSAFKLPNVSKKEAGELGLYNYPEISEVYRQQNILGLERLPFYQKNLDSLQRVVKQYEYLNGYFGPKYKTKVFVLVYCNKPVEIAHKQEAYWDGGNQNEVVVCIGLEPNTMSINWVHPFSWNKNKRLQVDLREEISETKYFDPYKNPQ